MSPGIYTTLKYKCAKNNTKSMVAGIRANHISQAISSRASIPIQAGRSLCPPKNRRGGAEIS